MVDEKRQEDSAEVARQEQLRRDTAALRERIAEVRRRLSEGK